MLNQCNFIGNLGKDVEVRSTQDGKKIANFSVAVTEKWKDKETTEWVRVVCFSEGLVGVCEKYLRKGSKVFISGKMQTRKWTDNSGVEKYSTEIILQQLELLSPKQSGEIDSHNEAKGNGYAPSEAVEGLDDAPPF